MWASPAMRTNEILKLIVRSITKPKQWWWTVFFIFFLFPSSPSTSKDGERKNPVLNLERLAWSCLKHIKYFISLSHFSLCASERFPKVPVMKSRKRNNVFSAFTASYSHSQSASNHPIRFRLKWKWKEILKKLNFFDCVHIWKRSGKGIKSKTRKTSCMEMTFDIFRTFTIPFMKLFVVQRSYVTNCVKWLTKFYCEWRTTFPSQILCCCHHCRSFREAERKIIYEILPSFLCLVISRK